MNVSPSGYLKERAVQTSQPIAALLELTYRCNWRCVFCYNPRHNDRTPLKGEEWTHILSELRTAGTMTVTLTGGEPLVHPDFLLIARAARERYLAIRIFTNATLFGGPLAREIAALYPVCVEVSLHGAGARTHDRITARPGSFDAFRAGLGHLVEAGVPLLVKTPLTKENEEELDEMIALVASFGVPYQLDLNLTPRDDGDLSPLQYVVPRSSLAALYQRPELARLIAPVARREGDVNCGLGRITVAIDPEGNVFPCPQWRHSSLGNLREARFADLWRTSEVRTQAAAVAVDANDRLMKMGEAISSFNFCPARALQTSGDLYTPDARMRANAEAASAIRASLD